MKSGRLLLASLYAAAGLAATGEPPTAYVSDDLVLGVYAQQDGQGSRLATLHSGASVAVLSTSGDYTQVRLGDGTTGWVKTAFLVAHEPAAARVKELEDELSRTRAAPAELAEAAANSEAQQLKHQLAAVQAELAALRAAPTTSGGMPAPAQSPWQLVLAAALLTLAFGFWLGYATMARRVKRKFGGIKVY